MKTKQIKTRNPITGVAEYLDVIDLEGVCDLAIFMWAEGERSAQLEAMVNWLGELGRYPTFGEFESWLPNIGVRLNMINVETHEG